MLVHEERDGTPVLKASGELSDKNVRAMHVMAKDIEEKGYKGLIVIDIEDVTHMDSRALGALISMWKMLDTDENDLVLYRPQGIVRELLHDTNLHRVLKIVDRI